MATLRKLANETVLYGLSSILGRLINWFLVPLYTNVFQEPNYPKSEYGIQTKIMAFVAVLTILITYGMETGFFRFTSDKKENQDQVYSTILTSLLSTSILFVILICVFLSPLSQMMHISGRSYLLLLLAITLGIDAFCSIPFAKLRVDNQPLRFAVIKLVNIGVNVSANLFFFLLCPYILEKEPSSFIRYIYNHDIGIGYVFISYLLASIVTLVLLLPLLKGFRFRINKLLLKRVLNYSFPIMLVGLVATLNINFDKMAMDTLLVGKEALNKVADYGAVFKLGVIMTLFTQAYRYAFEPFFFKNKSMNNAKILYADALKFFFITGLIAFLAVVFYIDWIALLLGKSYRGGIKIVPIILFANLFLGVYYSLSLWYKLTDKTRYGAYLAFVGLLITITLNLLLVPRYGYIGAAYAFLFSAITMTVCSYLLGQKFYYVPYQIKQLVVYLVIALGCFGLSEMSFVQEIIVWKQMIIKTFLLIFFCTIVVLSEPKLKSLFGQRKR